jgi:hypothetical protein
VLVVRNALCDTKHFLQYHRADSCERKQRTVHRTDDDDDDGTFHDREYDDWLNVDID